MHRRLANVFALAIVFACLAPPAAAGAAATCFGEAATIVGSDRDDDLYGTERRDVIFGGRGNDFIRGFDGNDLLCGGSGINELYGNGGRDRLDGGKSTRASLLVGGFGDDLLYDAPGGGHAQEMFGGPGDDVLKAGDNNGTYEDYLDGGAGNDLIEHGGGPAYFVGGDGDDVMRGGGPHELGREADYDVLDMRESVSVEVDLGAGTASGSGVGHDTLENFEIVLGGNGADTIRGDGARNFLIGGGGDDAIEGGGGDDCLSGPALESWNDCWDGFGVQGGSDEDTVDGGPGDDRLGAGAGDDAIVGGDGSDTAVFVQAPGPVHADLAAGTATGWGMDSLEGVEGIVGSTHPDSLSGTDGGDFLDGYFGEGDVLRGLGGDDTLGVGVAANVDGGEGNDTVSYLHAAPRTVDLRTDSDTVGNLLTSIENVFGSQAVVILTIHGDDGANFLRGGGGPDEIYGYGGDDTLHGWFGNDFLDAGDGVDDYIDGGDNQDGVDTCVNGETVRRCER